MLDKIQNDSTDLVSQSANLDRIKEIDIQNQYSKNDYGYFIDESDISDAAFEKYQRFSDIQKFSKILMQTDEQEALDLVLEKTFDGTISIDNDEFMSELLNNDDFLNDII